MARRKWRAGVQRELTLPQRLWTYYRWPLLAGAAVFAMACLAWYRYTVSDYQYGDNSTEYERAWQQCMADHTRHASDDLANDAAASACVTEVDEHRAR
ncbi:MAG TPA: hypothetical protein VFI23_07755 [Rhizomicrobium sp.]|nr:hypothetical protein [Rhizomicrobium sp.]